jgi:type VI secretion system protein ImpK
MPAWFTPAWFRVAVALILVFGLTTACKSRPRNAGCTDCAPSAPVIAEPSYPPPAPSYAPVDVAPAQPAPTVADVAAQDRATLERARNEDLERQLRLEQDRLAAAEGRLKEMEDKLADIDAPPPMPSPDLGAGPPADAAGEIAGDISARSVADVVRDGDMVIVRLTNGFRPGKDLLKQDVQLVQTLNATANALGRHPGATVAVIGHSDTDPIRKSQWTSNDELSLARAQRVAQVLADNGVDRNRISIDGRGAREPLIAPERSALDKARNRRVEIMIRP